MINILKAIHAGSVVVRILGDEFRDELKTSEKLHAEAMRGVRSHEENGRDSSASEDNTAVASDFLFGWLQFESISNFDGGFCLQGKGAICTRRSRTRLHVSGEPVISILHKVRKRFDETT